MADSLRTGISCSHNVHVSTGVPRPFFQVTAFVLSLFIVLVLDVVFRFSAEDDLRDGFKYTIGICVDALRDTSDVTLQSAGAVQVHKKTPTLNTDQHTHVIGKYEQAEIMSGSGFCCHSFMLIDYVFIVKSHKRVQSRKKYSC